MTSENNGMFMPVAPAYGYGGGNGGMFGDGNGWWILLLLLVCGGAWGNGFGGFGGGGGAFPWLMNGQANGVSDVQRGFDQNAIITGITGVQNAVTSGNTALQNALCNGFAQAEIAANGRQMADMNQIFGIQTGILTGFNGVQSQLAQCCCDNRAATADLKYTVATENCADRTALSDGVRDILASHTAGIQRILDQMCQDKIDAKNDTIAQLRSELLYARGQASQDVQTAAIQAGQRVLANEIEQYVAPKAMPAYLVQNPNCCANYGYAA